MMSRDFCSFSNRIRYSSPRQQIPAMRPNDAMLQKHVADNASWFPLRADGASFLSLRDEVPIFVTGGAIIALHPILLLRVPVSSFLRPMAEVHATTWTMAPPLVCLVSLHGGWAWACFSSSCLNLLSAFRVILLCQSHRSFCCSCLCFPGH